MPNKHFNGQIWPGGMKKGKGHAPALKAGGKTAFNEKPAFPSAELPGRGQGKDRSGGVTKVKTCPKAIGL